VGAVPRYGDRRCSLPSDRAIPNDARPNPDAGNGDIGHLPRVEASHEHEQGVAPREVDEGPTDVHGW
jgi:hypothetical protein